MGSPGGEGVTSDVCRGCLSLKWRINKTHGQPETLMVRGKAKRETMSSTTPS